MPDVDAFMAELDHARKGEVEALRAAILASDLAVTERVKWKAPSFGRDGGDDRVTFRLQPGDRVQLVLHRGAKVREADGFAFEEDPEGIVEWITPDRGTVSLADAEDTAARTPAVVALVGRWMRATT